MSNWIITDWNEALFYHFFWDEAGVRGPVHRLPVTPEELADVRDVDDPDFARKDFAESISWELEGQTLVAHAEQESTYWRPTSEDIPPFIAHLMLTCLAAVDTHGDNENEGDFRQRLRELTDGAGGGLAGLPALWESLRDWLRYARRRGWTVRTLVLPDPGNETQIGYSKGLAFPPRRDRERLQRLLSREELIGNEPPLLDVLNAVKRERNFTKRFRSAFEAFELGFNDERTDFDDDPFWQVVRDVALNTEAESAAEAATGAWSLYADVYESRLAPYLAGPTAWNQGAFASEQLEDAMPGVEFAARLKGASGDEYAAAVLAALEGADDAPKIPGLAKAVEQGVLLFAPDDHGEYKFTPRLPESENVRALVKPSVASRFANELTAHSPSVDLVESEFPGWLEVLGLRGVEFARIDFGDFAGNVRALQPTSAPPRIRIVGGVRVGTGEHLGTSARLPRVSVPDAKSVLAIGPDDRIVDLDQLDDGTWSFGDDRDWSGDWAVLADTDCGLLEATVSFVAAVAETDYKWPTEPGKWIREGARVDSRELGASDTPVVETTEVEQDLSRLASDEWPEERKPEAAVLDLERILAGLARNKTGIEERELLGLIQDVLGVSAWGTTWAIARAWRENGALVRGIQRHWSGRRYFPVRPHCIAYRVANTVRVALTGLTTERVREMFENVVASHGGICVPRHYSRWVGGPTVAWFDDEASAAAAVRQFSGDEKLRWLDVDPPPAPADVVRRTTAPLNFTDNALWDWEFRNFQRQETISRNGVRVLNKRLRGRPDYWLVEKGEDKRWSYARNWALLAAYRLAGEAPFAVMGDSAIVTRAVYLPLSVAISAQLLGGSPSGPIPSGGAHVYEFPTENLMREFVAPLVPNFDLLPRVESIEAFEELTAPPPPPDLKVEPAPQGTPSRFEGGTIGALADELGMPVEELADISVNLGLFKSRPDPDFPIGRYTRRRLEDRFRVHQRRARLVKQLRSLGRGGAFGVRIRRRSGHTSEAPVPSGVGGGQASVPLEAGARFDAVVVDNEGGDVRVRLLRGGEGIIPARELWPGVDLKPGQLVKVRVARPNGTETEFELVGVSFDASPEEDE